MKSSNSSSTDVDCDSDQYLPRVASLATIIGLIVFTGVEAGAFQSEHSFFSEIH